MKTTKKRVWELCTPLFSARPKHPKHLWAVTNTLHLQDLCNWAKASEMVSGRQKITRVVSLKQLTGPRTQFQHCLHQICLSINLGFLTQILNWGESDVECHIIHFYLLLLRSPFEITIKSTGPDFQWINAFSGRHQTNLNYTWKRCVHMHDS